MDFILIFSVPVQILRYLSPLRLFCLFYNSLKEQQREMVFFINVTHLGQKERIWNYFHFGHYYLSYAHFYVFFAV